MQRITLPGTNLTVSTIAYGTADLTPALSDEEVAALFNAYRDAGGTFIDTAHVYSFWTRYGAGASETTIARYLKANGRDDLVVATKGGHPGLAGYRRTNDWLDPARVHADIEDSLARLGVEQIDLYYLHRDDTRRSVAEIIDMLNAEIESGTIRAMGASNWTAERVAAANEYAASHGLAGFAASQVEWSYACRATPPAKPHGDQTVYAQEADLRFHLDSGLPLCAYAATARGFFSGESPHAHNYDAPVNRERRERARKVAADHDATATQVGLAWMLAQPFPCVAITGTLSLEHLRENLGAAQIDLSDEEIDFLSEPRCGRLEQEVKA